MSNFEKKFGKYAVSSLSMKLVILYIIGYVLYFVPCSTGSSGG